MDAPNFLPLRLASRLNPYIQGLIETDQSGFIPERRCSDNTCRLMHLIDKSHRCKVAAQLFCIDAEKALDSVLNIASFRPREPFLQLDFLLLLTPQSPDRSQR